MLCTFTYSKTSL